MDSIVEVAREPTLPERSMAVRRAAARLCVQMGWSPVHEVPLPNHRRADILALRPDGGFVCIEVKSGVRDFQTDGKWPEYRAYSDALFFAVDGDFPLAVLPPDTGLIVTCGLEAEMLRDGPAAPSGTRPPPCSDAAFCHHCRPAPCLAGRPGSDERGTHGVAGGVGARAGKIARRHDQQGAPANTGRT